MAARRVSTTRRAPGIAILNGGNAPPASNAPPPSTKKQTPTKPSELTPASEEELASKPKDTAGCSTSGTSSNGGSGLLIAGAVALSLLAARRRRG